MDWKAVGDKLLVRRHAAEEKTASGIEIPEVAKQKKVIGVVVQVGPGRLTANGERVPISFGVGAEVMFGQFSGIPVDELGPDMLVLREDEVLAYREVVA